jgi:hypothetical protein
VNLTTRVAGWLRSIPVGRPASRPVAPARRNRRRQASAAVVVGITAFLILQIGLGIAGECVLLIKDPGYADKELRLSRQEAAYPGAPSVVMLGTSRTGFAFHAGRIREGLARDLGGPAMAFNFGIPASGPVTHVVYLRRLLAEGHRPDFLLVEVLPPTLAELPGGPLESRFLFGDRLRYGEVETVIGYGFPEEEIREKWRGTVVAPWYAMRFPILGRIFPSALPWHLRFDWSRTKDPTGWSTPIVSSVTPEQYAAGLKRAAGEYSAILADMHPTGGGARALEDLLKLCRESDIPVTLVLMPESVGFRSLYSPATTDRLYRFLNQLHEEYRCGLVDARDWLPDSAFTDGHHMLQSGAEAFSDRLLREAIPPQLRARRSP